MRFFVLVIVLSAGVLTGCGDNTAGTATGKNSATNGVNNTAANSQTQTSGGGVVTDPTCADGLCSCPSGLVLCGTLCVDLSINTNHCGSCRQDCGSGDSVCISGQCECGGGAVQCGNSCADLSSDVDHCGDCGNDCNNNETCISGVCEGLMCTGTDVACQGACVDLAADAQNCGGCEDACFGGEVCQSGQCVCNGGTCADIGNEGRVVGGACDAGNTCADGSQCLTEPDFFPGGTCSTTCQSNSECPPATACVDNNGEGLCLLACEEGNMCRPGYECRDADLFAQNQGNNEVQVCIADGG